MRVRAVCDDDHDAVVALGDRLRVGVAPWRDPDAVSAAVRDWVRDSLSDPGTTVFVAESHGGHIVGMATVAARRHFTGQIDAYVGELAVASGHTRNGIGRQLLVAVEQWALARGYACVTLETGAANEMARAFYESLGYLAEDVRMTRPLGT